MITCSIYHCNQNRKRQTLNEFHHRRGIYLSVYLYLITELCLCERYDISNKPLGTNGPRTKNASDETQDIHIPFEPF